MHRTIDNVAILIPVHPRHYHYIYKLINKLKANQIKFDIYLVFSNNSDYNGFTMKDDIHHIICDNMNTKSIVTYKKFVGLRHLADSKYDHIICCDSELDIICNNLTNEIINGKIRQIFDTKKIYAGDSRDMCIPPAIMSTSAKVFPDKYEVLRTITNDFTLMCWWCDLPVYRRVDITPFLGMINMAELVWEQFDHILYQYYLILYHGFEMINTTPVTGARLSLEFLSTNNINVLNGLIDMKYGFSWTNRRMYALNQKFIEDQKGIFVYHLDR